MSDFVHATVLRDEAVALLSPRAGGLYVDATTGGGGHSEAILEASAPDGLVVCMDRDISAINAASVRLARFGERVRFVHSRFGDMPSSLAELGIAGCDGVIADLGVSSPQFDKAERGFSFRFDGPLDMRMDQSRGRTAADIVDQEDADTLADIIYQYGEERRSRRIARVIKTAHSEEPITTTGQLRAAVLRAVGRGRGQIDPATRTFQALRIAVNRELDELQLLLDALPSVLHAGGIASIISFHSLEDRMVKWAFRKSEDLTPITKKPLYASDEERAANPRSRSAKLRGARRLAVDA